MPRRWIAFDTEATAEIDGDVETQRWQMGCAISWRTDLKTGDHAQLATFDNPMALWQWVTDFAHAGQRTVIVAHNLGYDARIADVFNLLPRCGWELEWCNLDRNVSAMTWRGPKGTLVFMDSWTWLPVPLRDIGTSIQLPKLRMPHAKAKLWQWEEYCSRDAEIVYRAMSTIINFVKSNHLGNWQPTGAGMAYAVWRHKFMHHKVLVHDDIDAITAERSAMHTGRAEAWRHGTLLGDMWTELDMRNAYVTIASECDLPTKLKLRYGALSLAEYDRLTHVYAMLAKVKITTSDPVVPQHHDGRTRWPVGTFQTWLWDTEIALAREHDADIQIIDSYAYTRAPILRDWAYWILSLVNDNTCATDPVIRTWAKHCGRALIGRLSLRVPTWEMYGGNPGGHAGMSWLTEATTGRETRMLHVGARTLIETERTEGRDSLPQVTGWIMAECRARLWRAMRVAGLDEIAHVDTDSVIVTRRGLAALADDLGPDFAARWKVKGTWRVMRVYGPRNYRAGPLRKASGVPRKATETAVNTFAGEQWSGLAGDLEGGHAGAVTITRSTWTLDAPDRRRADAPGGLGRTVAYGA